MRKGILAAILLLSLEMCAQKQKKSAYRYTSKDSVTTAITHQYEVRSWLHQAIMGKNYRESWSTPVTLPVFRLSQSGFTIEKLGGGEQTKSLRLKDQSGKEWVLRTVNKTVSGALPGFLNNTPVETVVQDMISASHPYSPLIVSHLAKATGIIAPDPTYYFVADDPALGQYNSIFANTVCMLEEREPTPDGSDTEDTEDVQEKIRKENDHLVLQKKVLRARLLDMLVGDWDRHADQWRWDDIDSANTEYYYAIPRDRDNALFYSRGALPFLASISFMPHISGFKQKSTGLKRLNKKAHGFDGMFLNELNAAEWESTIREFQRLLTDSVVEASVRKLPPPVYNLDGKELSSRLKTRRDGLLTNAMKYYAFLSRTVRIHGTDEEEIFIASGKGKKLQISVYRNEENGRYLMYERLFDPSETGYIHLDGLKGNDRFVIEENAGSSIRLHIHGNEGKDTYDVKGKTRSRIFDEKSENNIVLNHRATKVVFN